MAIPQDEYIHIVSSDVGDATLTERELGGLVFTTTANLLTEETWDEYSTLVFYRDADVSAAFGSLSREAAFARDYFGYISPSATTPRKLTFCRILDSANPADVVEHIDQEDANFGSFMFLQSEIYTMDQIKSAIQKCKELNYKYQFAISVQKTVDGSDTTLDVDDPGAGSSKLSEVTAKDLFAYLKGDSDYVDYGEGTFMIVSTRPDVPAGGTTVESNASMDAFMPMALFASTDYTAANGTKNFMYKSFDGVTTAVDNLTDKKFYDNANINYYGLAQNYGQRRRFLQIGVNLDGEDAACFCNEIWLKSHISTQLFALMLDQEKIETGADGITLVYNTICDCVNLGKVNGTVEIQKELTDEQKRKIFRLTNDANAWQTIFQSGYWLKVEIKPKTIGNRTEYWAYYNLVYSKGDSVRKVEGKDFLV